MLNRSYPIFALVVVLFVLLFNTVSSAPIAAVDSSVLRHQSSVKFELFQAQLLPTTHGMHTPKAATTVLTTPRKDSFLNVMHNIVQGVRINIDLQISIRVPILISAFIVLCLGVLTFVSEEDEDESMEDHACHAFDAEKKALSSQ
ncbi:hypothetical protein J3R30DRAFT_3694529 [Lentinula aciculospora]|uniref:Transmembrane protein n=1 Tax=Lentinula aciculospora TaxID=153920 RepID=A0A9W9DYY7_9AGAR|nr:hypothetical protein J3R30DRAFT_3694529 [Lentinula aciculospora]